MAEGQKKNRLRTVAIMALAFFIALATGEFLLSKADGPVFVFGGGPLRSGEWVSLDGIDWTELDQLHELELEIVGAGSSRILWFSVHEGVPYVACDLDCVGGRLTRWPQQIQKDSRVVVRIDGRRALGHLVHVLHGTSEYEIAKAGRDHKYSGSQGGQAAMETAAHAAVVEVGEQLTGRSQRSEPGDRLYRIDPRPPDA
ncbi:hypothetical protein MK489_19165 [Myxococcota bacterium]|nr:hypothetical protein [Myxococcota bacterium]